MKKNKYTHWFVIGTFTLLYFVTSIVSTIHVVDFFLMTNPFWLSISLAVAFELGAAASLASLTILDKVNKPLVWFLFILLTLFQSMGNVYYSYYNASDFTAWSELFSLMDYDIIFQKRILASLSGGILPIIALGYIKSLVDYIKPSKDNIKNVENFDDFFDDNKEIKEKPANIKQENQKEIEINPEKIKKENKVIENKEENKEVENKEKNSPILIRPKIKSKENRWPIKTTKSIPKK